MKLQFAIPSPVVSTRAGSKRASAYFAKSSKAFSSFTTFNRSCLGSTSSISSCSKAVKMFLTSSIRLSP